MTKDIVARKNQHILLAQNPDSQTGKDLFSNYLLPTRSLPEIDLKNVSTEVKLLGKTLSQPLIISSMTGGSEHSKTINANIATACEKLKVAFGVGSQRVGLEVPEARESFELARKLAPNTLIFANMGADRLNYGYGVDDYRKVVDMVKADALYLHLNPLQEAIQPEGNTNYSNLLSKIELLFKKIGLPVFIKEVGHGLDPQTAKLLVGMGVAGVDAAGVGGTSWAWIEAKRAGNANLEKWFKDYGYPTDYLVPQLEKIKGKSVLVASGGIRSPIQGLKAHLLEADFYAAAQPFLKPALESPESVVKLLKDWQKGLQIALFSIGSLNWQEAATKKLIHHEIQTTP